MWGGGGCHVWACLCAENHGGKGEFSWVKRMEGGEKRRKGFLGVEAVREGSKCMREDCWPVLPGECLGFPWGML